MTRKAPDLTVITTHQNADFDALASMLAASLLYPGAVAVFPGSQEKGLKDFFVQSVSYTLNLKRPKEVELDQVARLVLVDTRQKSRIGKFARLVEDGRPVEIHIYDHHPPGEDDISGQMEMIEEVGACTSMLIRLVREKGIEITPDQATLLALGIYEDTGSFTFSSTTPADLEAGARLLEMGADLNLVSSLIVRQLDANQIGLLNDLLHHKEVLRFGGLEVTIASCSSDSYSPDFAMVAHKLVDMENIPVLFALARMENRIHLVARSRMEEVDVGLIASALGGGGHPYAASASVKDKTLIEVRQELILLLESQISPSRRAKDLMSFPIVSVGPKAPLSEASQTLTRYNVNVLLVMDGDDLVGQISRQVVEKGIFLGVDEELVEAYMNPELITIGPDEPLTAIQERIVGQRARILPVMDGGRVLGVVTRTDLLNILMDDPPIPDSLYDSRNGRSFVRKKNLKSLMTERIPKPVMSILDDLGRIGDELGYNVYAVGGFVRDLLLRRENLDVDVVVEGDGIAFAQEFGRRHGARVRDHTKFRTAVVVMPDGFKIDVATARVEYYESPAALPIVETSSLKLDLYRRDFTINTLALKLNRDHFGILIDYFGGQRDLKERAIRVLHSLSLVEDPTRCLRAVRFEQRYGFSIGKLTHNLIKNAIKLGSLGKANPGRLFVELAKILEERLPPLILARMDALGLWSAIHPALRFEEPEERHMYQVRLVLSWFDLLYLKLEFKRWLIYLLALVDRLRDKELNQVMDRLGLPDRQKILVRQSRVWSRRILRALERRPKMRPASLFRLLEQAPLEGQLWAMAKGDTDEYRRAFSYYFTELKKVKPLITGDTLIELGFSPGPLFKDILQTVRDARMNGWVRTVDDEKFFVLRRFGDERET